MAIGVAAQRSGAEQARADPTASVTITGPRVTLESPAFAFTLDTADGLRAVSWENRLTGRKLNLGLGPEVGLDVGLPKQPLKTPRFRVTQAPSAARGASLEAVFELEADGPPASLTVAYRWDGAQPVLRKFVTIANRGTAGWNRLLNVRLGTYQTDASVEASDPDYPVRLPKSHLGTEQEAIADPAGRLRGFPAYVERQFFTGLVHPAGFATADGAGLSLRQLPGVTLRPGANFACMEAVYGVSREGAARKAFCDHLLGRMRRVARGHDNPLAIFEPFGAKPDGNFWETEEFVRNNLAKVTEGQRDSGLRWDYYSLEFWHDSKGDLQRPHAGRFPNGFTNIVADLKPLGTSLGLWLDSGALGGWTIAENPVVAPALTSRAAGSLCRATEPANRFYLEGYAHQLRENGVRLVKFDNALFTCSNPSHDHLPGDYSTEAIQNAIIEFYRALDRLCPDVFIMLYWGYQSPWWLLEADTVYDIGMRMEGASFTPYPAVRARESVTRRLDQGRWMVKDLPALGWDTLGVWLSDWPWNSRVGKEAWQEGVVMDLCRGHLLAQLWSDTPYLSPGERRQMADFIALLKARPECFRRSRFVLGNPWKNEPYGYCCTDGRRAFLAINNGVWQDNRFTLELNSAWGLPDGQRWNLYRYWPEPARLGGELGAQVSMALRPFEIVLLEAVPPPESPTLARPFERRAIPTAFAEASQTVSLSVERPHAPEEAEAALAWTVLEPAGFRSLGGARLTQLPDGSVWASGDNPSPDTYVIRARTQLKTVTAVRLEALADDRLPHKGPGRAVNGNFTLTEFTISAAPGDKPGAFQPVRIRRADADFSQEGYGGWPVAAAIDGDPKSGWGIDPEEGSSHSAVFELERPIAFAPGAVLEFRLHQADRGHNLGRLRLSVTAAEPPLFVPKQNTDFVVRGRVPTAKTGGVMTVSVEFRQEAQPYWTRRCKSAFSITGTVSDRPVSFQAAVNNSEAYAAPWQTWRAVLGASDTPQPLEIRITTSLPKDVEHRFSAHFLPD